MRRKTVARATDTDSGFARIAGATAAIALPPQIAVPAVTRIAVSSSTRRRPREGEPRGARDGDAGRRVPDAAGADARDDAEVRRGPETHDGEAEEEVREALRPGRPRVADGQREDDPEDERPAGRHGRDEAGGRQERDENATGGHGRSVG